MASSGARGHTRKFSQIRIVELLGNAFKAKAAIPLIKISRQRVVKNSLAMSSSLLAPIACRRNCNARFARTATFGPNNDALEVTTEVAPREYAAYKIAANGSWPGPDIPGVFEGADDAQLRRV